jgi:hypothetical protein
MSSVGLRTNGMEGKSCHRQLAVRPDDCYSDRERAVETALDFFLARCRMRWLGAIMAAMILSLLAATTATAQTPGNYNYDRAYRHFARSRYSYRTLYSSTPGFNRMTFTPFGYQSQFLEPAYSRQRITPAGYDRYDYIPGLGGATQTPLGFNSYYIPGFGYGYSVPYVR